MEVVIMAQVVNVNFKLDADIKKSMEEACSEMGISMSAAFKIFAKKVGREKRIPFEGLGKPEPLRENLSGLWSRRINKEHRLVYLVRENTVLIFSCRGHYDD